MEENKTASDSSSSEIECLCSISNFRSIASNKPGYSRTVQLNNRELKKRDTFKVVIYPSGFNERTRDYVSLFVTRESLVELDLKVTCALSHPDGRPLYSKFTRKHLGLETTLGWTVFCHRNQVLSDDIGVLDRGKLTILCKFEFFEPDGNPSTHDESERLVELSENFRRSFPDSDFSDFVLRSPTKAFGVHKSILRARSPVLKAMLSLPNCSDEISLQGVSSDGLVAMLEFMYTGTLRHLSLALAYELYTAADKYGMLCLKKFCSEILANRLSVDNVLAMLLLSHGTKDSFLHTACLDCIVENMGEIKGRLEWIDMMQNNPELANNVIFYKEHKLGKNLKRHSRFL